MTLPLITAVAAGILIILQVILMLTVGLHRGKAGIFLGNGEDRDMERRVRRHGNLAENSGLFMAALAILEIIGADRTLITGIAIVFVFGRFAHAFGMSSLVGSHNEKGNKLFIVGRIIGAFSTLATGIAMGAALLIYAL